MCNKLNNCLPSRVCVCVHVYVYVSECRNVSTKEILRPKKKDFVKENAQVYESTVVLLTSCICMNAMHGVPVLLMLAVSVCE